MALTGVLVLMGLCIRLSIAMLRGVVSSKCRESQSADLKVRRVHFESLSETSPRAHYADPRAPPGVAPARQAAWLASAIGDPRCSGKTHLGCSGKQNRRKGTYVAPVGEPTVNPWLRLGVVYG